MSDQDYPPMFDDPQSMTGDPEDDFWGGGEPPYNIPTGPTPCGIVGIQVDDYTRYTWVRQKHGTIKINSVQHEDESYFWFFWGWKSSQHWHNPDC